MPNASEPERGGTPKRPGFDPRETGDEANEGYPPGASETEKVVFNRPGHEDGADSDPDGNERRFTAPGFDAKETQIISAASEPATEVFGPAGHDGATAQLGVPPRAA